MNKLTLEKIAELRDHYNKATKGDWFYNSYAGIYSEEKSREHMEMELRIPDDAPDEAYDKLPETCVVYVPTIAGDTATKEGAADATHIVDCHNHFEELLNLAEFAFHVCENEGDDYYGK